MNLDRIELVGLGITLLITSVGIYLSFLNAKIVRRLKIKFDAALIEVEDENKTETLKEMINRHLKHEISNSQKFLFDEDLYIQLSTVYTDFLHESEYYNSRTFYKILHHTHFDDNIKNRILKPAIQQRDVHAISSIYISYFIYLKAMESSKKSYHVHIHDINGYRFEHKGRNDHEQIYVSRSGTGLVGAY